MPAREVRVKKVPFLQVAKENLKAIRFDGKLNFNFQVIAGDGECFEWASQL